MSQRRRPWHASKRELARLIRTRLIHSHVTSCTWHAMRTWSSLVATLPCFSHSYLHRLPPPPPPPAPPPPRASPAPHAPAPIDLLLLKNLAVPGTGDRAWRRE